MIIYNLRLFPEYKKENCVNSNFLPDATRQDTLGLSYYCRNFPALIRTDGVSLDDLSGLH